jgi:hypothetical protein
VRSAQASRREKIMIGDPAFRIAVTPAEAARLLSVSPDFLAEWIAPELRWVRRGRKKLVAVRELERWVQDNAERTLEPRT